MVRSFSELGQYRLTMKYLSEMTDEQTLVVYSGHPLGLFPSHREAPRVVVTNGMVIPNCSSQDDWERFNALGVSQYGQMTAGSYMYIGPQGIVHGTTITLLNAARRAEPVAPGERKSRLFISSGLGGMSGAQPKAGNIAGVVSVTAEVNAKAIKTPSLSQGWVDEVHENLAELVSRVRKACIEGRWCPWHIMATSWTFGRFANEGLWADLGSDQTSLHNPWSGGYYPAGISFEEARIMMADEPDRFREMVKASVASSG
ncbi:MAG: hypothetical protein R2758_09295 [Bacteroidales bacterium]